MPSCNWSCRLGFPTKDAVLAQKRAWRDRAQTGLSMRSASVSEDKRWIMGQRCGLCAPSPTRFDALLKESCEYRPALAAGRDDRRYQLTVTFDKHPLRPIWPFLITSVQRRIGLQGRIEVVAAPVAVRETGLMWANMLRAFQVGKSLTSDGEPSSWMRPSRVTWPHESCPACHLTKASASAVM